MRGKSVCIVVLAFFVVLLSSSSVYAEDEQPLPHSAADGYEERLEEEGQQLEDFQQDYNKKSREMYNGYKREGIYKLQKKSGEILDAVAIRVNWENGGNVQYYMVNGHEVKKNSGDVSREINTYKPQSFVLKVDIQYVYKQPFSDTLINGKTVKAGTYTSTKSSVDFVEIELEDGSKVWVNSQYNPMYETQQNGYFLNSKVSLTEDKINSIPVFQMMMPVREDKRTGYPMKASYVTIHNTGNRDAGANALRHAQGQLNDSRSDISWHFTVDNTSIYQSMPMNEVGYHAGDGLSNGNGASIGIEICENADGNYAQAEVNAAYLTAHILYENGLPSDAIRMHKDWSGKDCPYNIIHGELGSMGWTKFKQMVKDEYDRLVKENTPNTSTSIPEELKTHLSSQGIKFDEGNISGFDLGQGLASIKTIIASYDPKAVITFIDSNGNPLSEETVLATGQKVIIKKEDGNIFNMDIVIYGDVNGDGKIGATDLYFLKNHIIKKSELSGAFYKAGMVDRNSAGATSLYKIKLDIIGKEKIQQR